MNHGVARKIIDQCTSNLSGWDERRGNYTESYVDRYLLIETVVRECAELTGSFEAAENIKKHFGIS